MNDNIQDTKCITIQQGYNLQWSGFPLSLNLFQFSMNILADPNPEYIPFNTHDSILYFRITPFSMPPVLTHPQDSLECDLHIVTIQENMDS